MKFGNWFRLVSELPNQKIPNFDPKFNRNYCNCILNFTKMNPNIPNLAKVISDEKVEPNLVFDSNSASILYLPKFVPYELNQTEPNFHSI